MREKYDKPIDVRLFFNHSEEKQRVIYSVIESERIDDTVYYLDIHNTRYAANWANVNMLYIQDTKPKEARWQ